MDHEVTPSHLGVISVKLTTDYPALIIDFHVFYDRLHNRLVSMVAGVSDNRWLQPAPTHFRCRLCMRRRFQRLILPDEDRAKKPSLTINLGKKRLKMTSKPPQMAGQADCLQGQERSAVTHPSSLICLSCDNRRTRYTAPLAILWVVRI
ncbi:hypothetical protein J6590_053530 [Homalodisca vitripennis]|nr:hypothetical protein J6590_053530 [Homalodisca vitripennis]